MPKYSLSNCKSDLRVKSTRADVQIYLTKKESPLCSTWIEAFGRRVVKLNLEYVNGNQVVCSVVGVFFFFNQCTYILMPFDDYVFHNSYRSHFGSNAEV